MTMFSILVLVCSLLTPVYLVYKPPSVLIRYFKHRWPDVLWHVETESKVVALTIDDCPSEHTKEIMDVLAANDAHATFFAIGSQIQGREETLQALIEAGHEVGNHAMYDEPSASLSNVTFKEQIQAVDWMIELAYAATNEATNLEQSPPRYFRPGSGFFHARMLALIKGLDYRLVLGSIFPHDPQIKYWWVNAMHILSMVRPGGIIICHDRRSWTAPMLRKVLPALKQRGYRVMTVSDLLRETESAAEAVEGVRKEQ